MELKANRDAFQAANQATTRLPNHSTAQSPMRIALVPVYNEEATLISVMEQLHRAADLLIIVDDGSRDRSPMLAEEWAEARKNVIVLRLAENMGMSVALREGFLHVVMLMESGQLGANDLLFTIDADGQHDSGQIAALSEYMQRNSLDVALTRRTFALYPVYKSLGNQLMSIWGSLWSGFRYHDIESGFRGMRLKVLRPLLEYYSGNRYSCAQEIAILTARLGFQIDNSFLTTIQLYRSQTRWRDVLINGFAGLAAFARWFAGRKVRRRASLARTPARSEPF